MPAAAARGGARPAIRIPQQPPVENMEVPPELSRRISTLIELLQSDDPESRRSAGDECSGSDAGPSTGWPLPRENDDSNLRREAARDHLRVSRTIGRRPWLAALLRRPRTGPSAKLQWKGLASAVTQRSALLVRFSRTIPGGSARPRSRALARLKASPCVQQIADLCSDPRRRRQVRSGQDPMRDWHGDAGNHWLPPPRRRQADSSAALRGLRMTCGDTRTLYGSIFDLVYDPDPEIARAAVDAQPILGDAEMWEMSESRTPPQSRTSPRKTSPRRLQQRNS